MESRITLLSVTTELPKAYGTALHIPGKTPPRHELHIDFQNCDTVTNPSFISSVREAIEQNKIDAIAMLNCPNTPAPEIWTALEGAQPTHLEMSCGYLERCGYEELSLIKNFWPLKSVYLGSYLGGGDWLEDEDGDRQSPSFPACYAAIETLVLNSPNARELFFYPTGGAQNLRSITIVENDALTTFVRTVQCNPKTSETLRTVTIGCWASYQGTSPEEIQSVKDFFRQSKALVNLELVLNDPSSGWGANTLDAEGGLADIYNRLESSYTDLPEYFPKSLEYLSLKGPSNALLLKDMKKWISCTRDPAWVPKLRVIAFETSLKNAMKEAGITEERERRLEGKVLQLFEILGKRDPPVKVGKGKMENELCYPLSP